MEQETKADIYNTLYKLFSLNLNTPEVIFNSKSCDPDYSSAVVNHTLKSISKANIKTVLRVRYDEPIEYLAPKELIAAVKGIDPKDSFVILRAPSKFTQYAGRCTISPFKNIIGFDKEIISLAWNDKLHTSDSLFNSIMHDINTLLGNVRAELDGYTIKWSYHKGNVGVIQRPILFWGI